MPIANDIDSIVTAACQHPRAEAAQPVAIALDGRSGAGKSTLAAVLAERLSAAIVAGDDFYAVMDDQDRWALDAAGGVAFYFDWKRLRDEALTPLRAGQTAQYRPFAWSVGAGLADTSVTFPPRPFVVVDGVYSARPELSDFIDITVLVITDDNERMRRIAVRRDDHALVGSTLNERWHSRWEAAEERYFTFVSPPTAFDLIVHGD